MFCGLAISQDNGKTFSRYSSCPILDRNQDELFARCGVHVIQDSGLWKMWYIGSLDNGWTKNKQGKILPLYTIRYLESIDGVNWSNSRGTECFKLNRLNEHGFARPFVYKDDDAYRMYYSIRTYDKGYQMAYAYSSDGKTWIKDQSPISCSSGNEWDAKNICYASIMGYGNKLYMFYNGNNYGETGFGYAEREI